MSNAFKFSPEALENSEYAQLEKRFAGMTHEQRAEASKHNQVPEDLYYVDPELKGVNPFDPDLTEEMRAKIETECRHNHAYRYHVFLKLADVQVSIS